MNPWLILGGTLLMAVLSVQGGTQVAGFQAGGQRANAQADLGNLRTAQEGAYALNGAYASTIAGLSLSTGLGVNTLYVPSGGVLHALATNTAATQYVAVAKAADGTYYATVSTSATIGSGATLAAALTDAGATAAWATANGITLPTAVS